MFTIFNCKLLAQATPFAEISCSAGQRMLEGGRAAERIVGVAGREFLSDAPFFDLVPGRSASWQTAHARVGGVV